MKNILIHGLGQTEASWSKVENELNNSKIQVEKPNLFDLTKNYHTNYENLYKVFADYCNRFKDNELNLCGISQCKNTDFNRLQENYKKVPKKQRTRIDFKPFLFLRHIVCCL